MTIGPSGEHMTFEQRMAEVRERYPDDHYVVQALDAGMTSAGKPWPARSGGSSRSG
jgi:hypothetical protein